MANLSYGKRMLKAGLESQGILQKKVKRLKPEEDAKWWCQAGLDKDGFKVKYISDYKGFGVFAEKDFRAGDFLLEYVGEIITEEEAFERQRKCDENKNFFYKNKGKSMCIDASTQDHICQYVNDGNKMANAVMKLLTFERPCLCLFAVRDIQEKEEILYNYGDTQNLWWRNKWNIHVMETQKMMKMDRVTMREAVAAATKGTSQVLFRSP
ncbi:uncharacterized protein LOC130046414 [Ostrea edulis]|uniref:uncharacterized protein LOC130046414 n=1 Tax=Ostrea edulis TaxID=37623 RepID=UPI0024AFD018|nr:uncharacterized protein LOC130046414 [Ostrea edulis]